jgi:rod shape-determining protein MreC
MEQGGRLGRHLARLIQLDRAFRNMEERGLLQGLEQRRLEAVEAENRRLLEIFHMPPLPRYDGVVARVWAREPGDWFNSFTVRAGAQDGIKLSDPVIVLEAGRQVLLGQIVDVFQKTARVLLVTDPSSAVSVEVLRTGDQGAVEGLGRGKMALNYLYADADVRAGDEVVTAGLGQIFPKGLLVGIVSVVEAPAAESFRRAIVRPTIRAGRVSEVVVLRRRESRP